ncbi:aminotransferase class IV [Terrisporobacter glycolicus]|nr:aminotransferase class IV [Terrisporobacter glycolicus]
MKNSVSFNSELSKFGIGLFETIKIEDGPIDLDLHMNRMFKSIESLNMNIKYHKEFLTQSILNYIDENKIKNKALRITVFDEGYNISTRPITYNEEIYKKGFKLTISPIKREIV